MTQRFGDWMQTYTGQAFWPLDPRVEEIDILDIAHSLSMQCRYAGHCTRFYSVAEHSVLLAKAMPTVELARSALLHDAAEAYLVDVPRPVKRFLGDYRHYEENLEKQIAIRFGIARAIPPEVKEADDRILADEMAQIMLAPPMPWAKVSQPLGVKILGLEPDDAKAAFLNLATELEIV